MDWRLAESLKKLREQINAAYPGRDKASDGAIGDAAHASRNSDHNPWIFDGRTHVVSAIDIDEDLEGIDGRGSVMDIVKAICQSRDRRVKYIIYEGKITVQGSQLQQWKPYTGKNAHRQHAHISVFPARKLYDNRAEWSIGARVPKYAADGPVLEIPPFAVPSVPATPVPTVEPTVPPAPPPPPEQQPMGDLPGVEPRHWFSVEDWKPWAKRWASRIWTAVSTVSLPTGGAFSLGAINAGENWWIWVIAGAAVLMLIAGLGVFATVVVAGIWMWQNRGIPQLKIEQYKALVDPNAPNVGLIFEKK